MRSNEENLPPELSEDAGWDAWEEHLLRTDREELVQLLLTRMSSDPAFMRFMYTRYAKSRKAEDEMGNRIRVFRESVLEEMIGQEPDAEYLVSLSERCFSLCGKESGSAVRLLLAVVLTLDEVLAAGRFEGEDAILLEDCIWDAVKMIRRIPDAAAGLLKEAQKVSRTEKTGRLLAESIRE